MQIARGNQSYKRLFILLAVACVALVSVVPITWAQDESVPNDHRVQQQPPILLGSSGMNGAVNGGNANQPLLGCSAGTLGALVADNATPPNLYILSNNHVLARTNRAAIGEPVIHTSTADNLDNNRRNPPCTTAGTLRVGALSNYRRLSFAIGVPNVADVAIARVQIVGGQLGVNRQGSIIDILIPSGNPQAPRRTMNVQKSGRTTGTTSGHITAINVLIAVPGYPGGAPPATCPAPTCTASFAGVFLIQGDPGVFSEPGDSGSLVVDTARPNANPVGLLFGGNQLTGLSIASPIQATLNELNKAGTVGGQIKVAFQSASGTAGQSGSDENSMTPDEMAASEVKAKYSEFLMSLPEVVGHGIGSSSTGSGAPVIQVYLRRATDQALAAIPASLEGIPVDPVEVGNITLF